MSRCRAVASRKSRRPQKAAIRATPTGSAKARHALEMPSAGVVIAASSTAYSHAGHAIMARNARQAAMAPASNTPLVAGESFPTTAVIRMCSPRRNATTAPSMASQRNRIAASSSDHSSGACRTKRAMTPASSTPISTMTSNPAVTSTIAPRVASARSSQASRWMRRPAGSALDASAGSDVIMIDAQPSLPV